MTMQCCLLLRKQSTWSDKSDIIPFAVFLATAGCVAPPQTGLWKHGAGGAAADGSQGTYL